MAVTANAAPVTYDYTGGFVTVSAFQGSSNTDVLAAGTQIQVTGGQVTFDSAALTLPSFQFLDRTPQTVTVIGGAFTGGTDYAAVLECHTRRNLYQQRFFERYLTADLRFYRG